MINFSMISKSALFRGIEPSEVEAMLQCLQARTVAYKKGERIFHVGQPVSEMGLVLAGGATIESDDVWGNRTIVDHVGPGESFAEAYACAPGEPLMVSVVAAEACEALFLNVERVMTTCSSACAHHNRLVKNLLTVTALRNLDLTRRMFHLSPKSIRGKLLSYLSDQAIRQGRYRFEIPFNRQQLADYLGVDRSAMSNELSKMAREGLVRFERNVFTLTERAP
jgi:CRP-like cAMP-binding protein